MQDIYITEGQQKVKSALAMHLKCYYQTALSQIKYAKVFSATLICRFHQEHPKYFMWIAAEECQRQNMLQHLIQNQT